MTDTTLLEQLLREYDVARSYSELLVVGLTDDQICWRPHANSSAIAWHLGHQAAVNHFMVRNLTAAEPPINAAFDALFDSATPEPDRGAVPPVSHILEYRSRVAQATTATIDRIAAGEVGAPAQLTRIAEGLLRAIINHEYQHDTWVLEVRRDFGESLDVGPASHNVVDVEGYWMLDL